MASAGTSRSREDVKNKYGKFSNLIPLTSAILLLEFFILFDDFSQYYKVGSSLEIVCEVREKRGKQFDSKNLCFTWKLSSLNTKNSVQITFLSVNIYLQKFWTIVEKNHENIVTHSNVDRYKSNRDEGRRLELSYSSWHVVPAGLSASVLELQWDWGSPPVDPPGQHHHAQAKEGHQVSSF